MTPRRRGEERVPKGAAKGSEQGEGTLKRWITFRTKPSQITGGTELSEQPQSVSSRNYENKRTRHTQLTKNHDKTSYSRSPKNPTLQLSQNSSKSASTTPQRPIWNTFGTVAVRDFWENGCTSPTTFSSSVAALPDECAPSTWEAQAVDRRHLNAASPPVTYQPTTAGWRRRAAAAVGAADQPAAHGAWRGRWRGEVGSAQPPTSRAPSGSSAAARNGG